MKNRLENAFVTAVENFAKISMDGKLAIGIRENGKENRTYKYYDAQTNKLIDCTDFCIDLPENAIFTVPVKVTDLVIGDIIITDGSLDCGRNINCVTNVNDGEITVINFLSGKKEILVSECLCYMKDIAYAIKIVNLFGNMFNGIGQTNDNDMMKYFMLTKMTDGKNENMLPMMFMMNGGNFAGDNDMMKYFMLTKMTYGKNENMLPMMFMMNGGNFAGDNDMMKYFMLTKMTDGKNENMLPMMFMMNGGNFNFDNRFKNNTKKPKTKS